MSFIVFPHTNARSRARAGWADGWVWPLLGLIFLPFATLIYVILWQAGGLSGWDWFWVAIAALFDIGHWGAGAAQRRAQTSGV